MNEQETSDRVNNRSHRPTSKAFFDFVTSSWGDDVPAESSRRAVADFAAARRDKLAAAFPGERLVIPAGGLKIRSNDTDYRFRPHTAFAHLTGLGTDEEPDAVLVINPLPNGGHEDTLYFRPASGKESSEFFSDSRYGEFWVGRRPTLDEVSGRIGIPTQHLGSLPDALAKDAGQVSLRVIAEADAGVTTLVETIRAQSQLETSRAQAEKGELTQDEKLLEAASEIRLVKDHWEVEQMKEAIAATIEGFKRVVNDLPRALDHRRGERVVEATFETAAREEGNGVGYETIAAAGDHATTLHWITNDGPIHPNELLLLDAGVEADSLYTADITRTIPVSGMYTEVQRRVLDAVVDAADAAFKVAVPGHKFRDVHETALDVLAQRLDEWGLLPVSLEEALSAEGQQHRRWMVHGTSHHLGLDVHDCAQARAEMYLDGQILPGMIFTIEPGLYFKANDLTVPPEYRGIGVRCEDDVLVTDDGNINLTAALPRRPDDVEAWMRQLRG